MAQNNRLTLDDIFGADAESPKTNNIPFGTQETLKSSVAPMYEPTKKGEAPYTPTLSATEADEALKEMAVTPTQPKGYDEEAMKEFIGKGLGNLDIKTPEVKGININPSLSQTDNPLDKMLGNVADNRKYIYDTLEGEEIRKGEAQRALFDEYAKRKVGAGNLMSAEDLPSATTIGSGDLEEKVYSFDTETLPKNVVDEYLAAWNNDVLHQKRFKEDAEYRNDWMLRHTGKSERRYREELADELETRLNAMKKDLQKGKQTSLNTGLGYAAIGAAANKPSSGAALSVEKIDKALEVVNTLRKNNFGAGFAEGFDLGNILTLDLKDLGMNVALIKALNKDTRGEELNANEKALVEAWSITQDAEEAMEMLGGRSWKANVGHGLAYSIGVIPQFAATQGIATSASKGISRAAAKVALKRAMNTAANKGIGSALKYGSLKVAESAVGNLARVPFAGSTYRNYTDKRLNQFQLEERLNEATGKMEKVIGKQETSALKDAIHSFVESYFEFQSEDFGQALDFGVKAFAKSLPRKNKLHQMAVSGLSGPVKGGIPRYLRETAKIGSLGAEVLEEAVNDVATNTLHQDDEGWKRMATWQYWWELSCVSAMLSSGFGVINYASNKSERKQVNALKKVRTRALDNIDNEALRKHLNDASSLDDLTERSKMLANLDWGGELTREDMANAIDFITAQTKLDVIDYSASEADRLDRMTPYLERLSIAARDGEISDADVQRLAEEAYTRAFRVQENQQDLARIADRIRVATEAGMYAKDINDLIANAGLKVYNVGDEVEMLDGTKGSVNRVLAGAYEVIDEDGDIEVYQFEEVLQPSPEVREAQVATTEQSAEAQAEPTQQDVEQKAVAEAVEAARAEADKVKNADDGFIYESTLTDGSRVNIVKGANIVYDETNGEVDYDASDATVVVQYEDGTRKQVSIRDIDSIDEVVSVDEVAEMAGQTTQTAIETAQQAEVQAEQADPTEQTTAEAPAEVAQATEQTTTQEAAQTPEIPRLKNGRPDYNAMTPEMFAEQYTASYGAEKTIKLAQANIADADKVIADLEKKQDSLIDPNKIDEVQVKLEEAKARKARYEAVLNIMNTPKAEPIATEAQNEVAEVETQPTEEVQPQVEEAQTPEVEAVEDPKQGLRQRIAAWEDKLGVPVKVIERVEDIENAKAREAIESGVNITGWYDKNTGEVYFYLPNVVDTQEVDSTIVHEIVAHKGLEQMLGKETFGALCDRVWDMMSEKDRNTFLAYPGVNGDHRKAADEYIAHLAERTDLTAAETTIWQEIVNFIREAIAKIASDVQLTNEDIEGLIRASYRNLAAHRLEAQGAQVDVDKGDVLFAVKDVLSGKEREKAIKDIMAVTGRSRDEVEKYLKAEESLAKVILDGDNVAFLDLQVDESVPSIWQNSDYPQGTVEFSNICRKRLPFTMIYSQLQKEFPNTVFDASTLETIRGVLKDNGVDVACGLCFVEDRRQLLGEIGQEFIDAVRGDHTTTNENQISALEALRASGDTYIPNLYELITLEGMKELRQSHPEVAAAFIRYNNARGMQAGRLFQAYSAYHREIRKFSKAQVKKINDNGGLRIFSFSDFEAHHLIDLVQVLTDCASKGIKVQGYTKVPEFARAVKNTKMKVNRSLIAKGVGYVEDGYVPKKNEAVSPNVIGGKRLLLDTVEGINVNDDNFFDSTNSPSIGNILVGINDEQIRLAMADPFVDYIIPFHTGIKKATLEQKGIGDWVNYKNYQVEKVMGANGKLKKAPTHINIYTDVLSDDITNEKQFVKRYLEVCREKGYVPKFPQFLKTNAKGEYVYTKGYYKFLIDFKLFDKSGRILPQEAVVPVFDNAFNKQILNKYVADEKAKAPNDEVYAEVKEALGLEDVSFRVAERAERDNSDKTSVSEGIGVLFKAAVRGEFVGQPVSIGRLTPEGRRFLEKVSGVKMRERVNFVLNPSDLRHIYLDHYGENEKDNGQNIPLTLHDIKRIVDVISYPDRVVYGEEKTSGRKLFYFLMDSANGTYNLLEVYANSKGNLTAKTYYKTKKDAAQRVMELNKTLLPTAEPYSGAILSNAKIPQIFESTKEDAENISFRVAYHGSAADFDKFDRKFAGSGEGQAVMGAGHYVTTSEGTGRYYAETASNMRRKVVQEGGYTYNGEVVRSRYLVDAYETLKRNNFDVDKAIEEVERGIATMRRVRGENANTTSAEERLKLLKEEKAHKGTLGYQEEIIEKPTRHLYEVEIPDDNGKNYFDLDKKATKKTKDEAKRRMLAVLYNGEESDYWKRNRDVIDDEWRYNVESSSATNDAVRVTMEQFLTLEEVSDILSDMGYVGSKSKATDGTTYIIYKDEDLEIKENIRFRFIGEIGASNLDKAEEATTRIDDLKVAREMEASGKDAKEIKMATGWERGADNKWRYEVLDIKILPPEEWVNKRGSAKLPDIIAEDNGLFVEYPELRKVKVKKSTAFGGGSYLPKENTIVIGVGTLKKAVAILEDPSRFGQTEEGFLPTFEVVKSEAEGTLVHEIQHIIQHKEGFAKGGSPQMTHPKYDKDLVASEYARMASAINDKVREYNSLPVSERRTYKAIALRNNIDNGRKNLAKFVKSMQLGEDDYRKLGGEVEARNVEKRKDYTMAQRLATLARETEDVSRKDQIFIFNAIENSDKAMVGTAFSGGGLIEAGLQGLIDPQFAIEYDSKIAGVYRNNHGDHILVADIRDVDMKDLAEEVEGGLDYFHASPVCKRFSSMRQEQGEVELDIETAQATANIIREKSPKVVTIENVPRYKGSKAMSIIEDALNEGGYTWDANIYNAADYGAATSRSRLIVRAVKDGNLPAVPNKVERKVGWYEVVADLVDDLPTTALAPYQVDRLKKDGIDVRNIKEPLFVFDGGSPNGKARYSWASEPLATITASGSADRIVLPNGEVKLVSARVLARIMGLPDTYQLPESRTLAHTILGNGVPTALTKAVIAPMLEQFQDEQYAAVDEGIRFRVAPTFYSNAENAVKSIKQEKATPEQWLKMIEKNGGLKAGEDKWLRLSDWLKDSEKKTLTKQEVLDYINENQIQIEEVKYAEENSMVKTIKESPEFAALRKEYFDLKTEIKEEAETKLREKYGPDFDIAFSVFGDLFVKDDKAAAKLLGIPYGNADLPIQGSRLMYSTQGLTNKREIALTVPTIEPWNEGDQIHFGDAGEGRAIAWIRFGDTTDEYGFRVLVIDEIQSKRHQEGRERGYATDVTEEQVKKAREEADVAFRMLESFDEQMAQKYGTRFWSDQGTNEEYAHWELLRSEFDRYGRIYEELYDKRSKAIPAAPFEKNWHELAIKRMLRYAAENGYDAIAWTKGDQQAERYNIGSVVQRITSYEDGDNRMVIIRLNNNEPLNLKVDSEDKIVSSNREIGANTLSDVVGKELAVKIMNNEGEDATYYNGRDIPAKVIAGDGLRIGGEGMRGFYDQILPSFMNKYGKKWGVKVQDITLPFIEEAGRTMHSVDVTDAMRESVMEGQPMFRVKQTPRVSFLENQADDAARAYVNEQMDIIDKMGTARLGERAYSFERMLARGGSERDLRAYEALTEYAREAIAERPDKYEAHEYNLKDGEHGVEILDELFHEFNTSKETEQLFSYVYPAAKRLGISVRVQPMRNWGEHYQGIVALNGGFFNSDIVPDSRKAEVILHELIHSVTTNAIYFVENPSWQRHFMFQPNENLKAAVKNIKDIYNNIAKSEEFEDEYGVTNVHEFMAELSNPQFVEKLKKHNLWTEIVDAIKRIVSAFVPDGIYSSSNAHKEAMDALEKIVENMPAEKQVAVNYYWQKKRPYEAMNSSQYSLKGDAVERAEIERTAKANGAWLKAPNAKQAFWISPEVDAMRDSVMEGQLMFRVGDIEVQEDTATEETTQPTEEEKKAAEAEKRMKSLARLQKSVRDLVKKLHRSKKDDADIAKMIAEALEAEVSKEGLQKFLDTGRFIQEITLGISRESIQSALNRMSDQIANAVIKHRKELLEKTMGIQVQSTTSMGIAIAHGVDDRTRAMIELFRRFHRLSKPAPAYENSGLTIGSKVLEVTKSREDFENFIDSRESDISEIDKMDLMRWHTLWSEIAELEDAYITISLDIDRQTQRSKELYQRLKTVQKGSEAEKALKKDRKLALEAKRNMARERLDAKQQIAQKLGDLLTTLSQRIKVGREARKGQKAVDEKYRKDYLNRAMEDVRVGNKVKAYDDGITEEELKKKKQQQKRLGFRKEHYYSFVYMVQSVSVNAIEGRGFLYDTLIEGEDGVMACQNREIEMNNADEAKIYEFAKQLGFRNLDEFANFFDQPLIYNGQQYMLLHENTYEGSEDKRRHGRVAVEEVPMTVGYALYLVMMAEQPSIAPTITKGMRLTSDEIDILRSALSKDAYKRAMDFKEFAVDMLHDLREDRYNQASLDRFGTQLDNNENYFPVRRLTKNLRTKQVDLDQITSIVAEDAKASVTASALIKRVKSYTAIDVRQNPLRLMMDHIHEMNHFAATAPVVRNVEILLNSQSFKEQLNIQKNELGQDKMNNYDRFELAAALAVGSFKPITNTLNDILAGMQSMVSAGKVSFRFYTAAKQVLSLPAFMAYSPSLKYQALLLKNLFGFVSLPKKEGEKRFTNVVSWCMQNLPTYAERWREKHAGDERIQSLKATKLAKWMYRTHFTTRATMKFIEQIGMWANAAVDIFVCGVGAHTIYEYEVSRLKAQGMAATDAEALAKRRAAIGFNESQQSSLNAFMSPAQRQKDLQSLATAVFENSNRSYGRKASIAGDYLRTELLDEKLRKKRYDLEVKRETERLETQMRNKLRAQNNAERDLSNRLSDEQIEEQIQAKREDIAKEAERNASAKISEARRRAGAEWFVYKVGLNYLWKISPMLATSMFMLGDDDEDKEGLNDYSLSLMLKYLAASYFRNGVGGATFEGLVDGYGFSNMLTENTEKLYLNISKFVEGFNEEDAEVDWQAFRLALNAVANLGVNFDAQTFYNFYKGIHGMIYDREINDEDILRFISAPKSLINATTIPINEGESEHDYVRRLAYLNSISEDEVDRVEGLYKDQRTARDRSKLSKLNKWAKNYRAISEAKMLDTPYERSQQGSITVPMLEDLDDEYKATITAARRTRSGSIFADVKEYTPLTGEQKKRSADLAKTIRRINRIETALNKTEVSSPTYKEMLTEMIELKESVVARWNK